MRRIDETLWSEQNVRKPNDSCMALMGSVKQITLYLIKRDENNDIWCFWCFSINQNQTTREPILVYDPKTLPPTYLYYSLYQPSQILLEHKKLATKKLIVHV